MTTARRKHIIQDVTIIFTNFLSPLFLRKSPLFLQKSPLFLQKSPLFLQMSPFFLQNGQNSKCHHFGIPPYFIYCKLDGAGR